QCHGGEFLRSIRGRDFSRYLEEADLFLASDNSIPPGIEDVADDTEGDIRFLEELLINDSILSHESSDSNFEDNPSIPRPPPERPDAKNDAKEEIPVVVTPPKWLATEYESGACYFEDQHHKIYIERPFKSRKTDTLDFQQHLYKKPEA
nr:hypothetical protein [Tanacetum cinerariifolium]